MVRRALAQRRGSLEVETLAEGEFKSLEQVELDYIKQVLRACKFNQARAARILGIGRNTLWRKLKKDQAAMDRDAPD